MDSVDVNNLCVEAGLRSRGWRLLNYLSQSLNCLAIIMDLECQRYKKKNLSINLKMRKTLKAYAKTESTPYVHTSPIRMTVKKIKHNKTPLFKLSLIDVSIGTKQSRYREYFSLLKQEGMQCEYDTDFLLNSSVNIPDKMYHKNIEQTIKRVNLLNKTALFYFEFHQLILKHSSEWNLFKDGPFSLDADANDELVALFKHDTSIDIYTHLLDCAIRVSSNYFEGTGRAMTSFISEYNKISKDIFTQDSKEKNKINNESGNESLPGYLFKINPVVFAIKNLTFRLSLNGTLLKNKRIRIRIFKNEDVKSNTRFHSNVKLLKKDKCPYYEAFFVLNNKDNTAPFIFKNIVSTSVDQINYLNKAAQDLSEKLIELNNLKKEITDNPKEYLFSNDRQKLKSLWS